MKEYLVEFKVGCAWIQTKTFCIEAAVIVGKTLHDAGIKARIVVLTTERSFIGA